MPLVPVPVLDGAVGVVCPAGPPWPPGPLSSGPPGPCLPGPPGPPRPPAMAKGFCCRPCFIMAARSLGKSPAFTPWSMVALPAAMAALLSLVTEMPSCAASFWRNTSP
ncbi:hypothetical protein E7T09_06245 [Deinococcus sp. KSM4-11]|nr:hypothetical protein E7T09_06245 [Deinococcus sp. KSM4-11]